MLTDHHRFYEGPHKGLTRRLRFTRAELRGLARREFQHSQNDTLANQQLAFERMGMYKNLAVIVDHVIGGIEEIDAHVKRYPDGAT